MGPHVIFSGWGGQARIHRCSLAGLRTRAVVGQCCGGGWRVGQFPVAGYIWSMVLVADGDTKVAAGSIYVCMLATLSQSAGSPLRLGSMFVMGRRYVLGESLV